ncbi:MAG: UDP-glucose 4-epimerase [Thermoleophilaceae bacterium]|nr:UDP-glucose 4-epimerase [Thermoleophilaceae bacterium]
MRVVVVGATGNVGTSVLHALADEPQVESILGVARRLPEMSFHKTDWVAADITRDELEPLFRGADAVVHLAWLIQPSRNLAITRATNVDGSARVFRAAGRAHVGTLVYASSVGAYSPGPKDRAVDESWPTGGIETSFYSRHKAEVERVLDRFEAEYPSVRSVRLRPGLIFKREAASEIRRYFGGPLIPSPLVRPGLIPVVPDVERLRFQAVHSLDVGDAYRLGVVHPEARGAYNVAAEPVLDPEKLGELLGARPVKTPAAALRGMADIAWKLRLQPTPKGWVDMALGVPIMDSSRIRSELGWTPRRGADDALLELLAGMRDRSGADTPPLRTGAGGPLRVRELLTGVGRTSK